MDVKGYDEKCYELAEYFLSEDADLDVSDLAQTIQDAIEDWLLQMGRGQKDEKRKIASARKGIK